MHSLHRTCHNGAPTVKANLAEGGGGAKGAKRPAGNIQYLSAHLCSAYVNIGSSFPPFFLRERERERRENRGARRRKRGGNEDMAAYRKERIRVDGE